MFGLNEPRDLPEVFAKYAGMEIPTKTVTKPAHWGEDRLEKMTPEEREETKKKYPALTSPRKELEPTEEGVKILKEIYQIAKDNNVNLRLWRPLSMGTMDVQHSRLNMRIKEESDGKWRVQRTCHYG